MKGLLKTKAMVLAIIVTASFCAAIPLTIADDSQVAIRVVAGDNVFETRIEVAELLKVQKMIKENATSGEISNYLGFTEEQTSTMLSAGTLKIVLVEPESDDTSYGEIVFWIPEWSDNYGVYTHIHLRVEDAINLDTAMKALGIIMVLITALLAPTGIGLIAAAIADFLIAMMWFDYHTLYSNDKNPNGSFDTWSFLTEWFYLMVRVSYIYMYTPHFLWWCSLVGAYIRESKIVPNGWYSPWSLNIRYGLSYGRAYRL